jgi:hypothetical protein
MHQESGYAIVQMPAPLVASYDAYMQSHKASDLFQRLCKTLGPLPRSAYRGIDRNALKPLPATDPDILRAFEETGCDVHTEYSARHRFLQMLGHSIPEGDFAEDLLPNMQLASEIFALLQSPADYEIVQFVRGQFHSEGECLGYDVGYWAGNHYSIVSDSAVRPVWHPPDPDCFGTLALELRAVNDCFLFPSSDEAARFRSWYRTQAWAETEFRPDESCIIQVIKPKS